MQKGSLLTTFRKNRNNGEVINCLNKINVRLALLISNPKQNNYTRMAKKLENVQRSSLAYWSLLKNFPNHKKIQIISPLYQKDEFVSDF